MKKALAVLAILVLAVSTFVWAAATGDKLVVGQGGRPYYDVYDEDTMASDSATGIPTQQSVKAYHDTGYGASVVFEGATADAYETPHDELGARET